MNYFQFFIYIPLFILHWCVSEDVCYKGDNCINQLENRYLFYDVNHPEGFNLRRDVYMRFALLAHKMSKSSNPFLNKFKLVLAPWSHLVHWKYSEEPEQIPWGYYFDLKSLQEFAPVIEMHAYFDNYPRRYTKVNIDEVYTLQHFEDMFETGNFEDRMQLEECVQIQHNFYYYNNITYNNHYCLYYHGPATKLRELFLNTSAKSILINHAEVALHEFFGDKLYWMARRSMRFSRELMQLANDFRSTHLASTDQNDNTVLPRNWMDEKAGRNARGGPYVAIHMRRRDFVKHRPKETPTVANIAQQVTGSLEKLHLNTIFVATDTSDAEFTQLQKLLSRYHVKKYIPDAAVKAKYKDGGVAIIDQIICSYARYFIGTHESTFTFRIQEEREILGFPVETTFNVLCKDNNCMHPSVWKIVY